MSKYLERLEHYKLRKEFEEWYTKTFNTSHHKPLTELWDEYSEMYRLDTLESKWRLYQAMSCHFREKYAHGIIVEDEDEGFSQLLTNELLYDTKPISCVNTSCTSCGHSFSVALPRRVSLYDYKEIQEIVSELIMSVNNPHQVVQHIVDKVCYREQVDKLESAMAEIYKLTVEQLLSGETHMLYYYPETIKGIAKEFIDKTYKRV